MLINLKNCIQRKRIPKASIRLFINREIWKYRDKKWNVYFNTTTLFKKSWICNQKSYLFYQEIYICKFEEIYLYNEYQLNAQHNSWNNNHRWLDDQPYQSKKFSAPERPMAHLVIVFVAPNLQTLFTFWGLQRTLSQLIIQITDSS